MRDYIYESYMDKNMDKTDVSYKFNYFENSWGVLCSDLDKAREVILDIEEMCGKEILRKTDGVSGLKTMFKDGTVLRWINPSSSVRGNKYGKLWCDRNTPAAVFEQSALCFYMGKMDDIVWF